MDSKEDQIKRELARTVSSVHYNGWNNKRAQFGYHSYNIGEINIIGQRTPAQRLKRISDFVDFENKRVLDLGCNVGAMLHHLPQIQEGLGLDYDDKCIVAANNIAKILDQENLEFMTHDFDRDTYPTLKEKIKFHPDVIFILSLGSWIQSWRALYDACLQYDCAIVLETNNDEEGLPQLTFFMDRDCKITLISDNSADDTSGNNRRKTYLVSR